MQQTLFEVAWLLVQQRRIDGQIEVWSEPPYLGSCWNRIDRKHSHAMKGTRLKASRYQEHDSSGWILFGITHLR
jgi:hypothetical protein